MVRTILHVSGALALSGALLSMSGADAAAQSRSAGELVGTWRVEVSLRHCDTQALLHTDNALVTFHRDGTITESAQGAAFAPGQRGSAQGVWTYHGAGRYSQRMTALVKFDSSPNLPGTPTFDPARPVSPGFFAGWQTVIHALEFRGEELVSSGTNSFHKFDGTLYRTGCSTVVAKRFE